MKLLFDNGDQHVSSDGVPDLRFDRVLAVADETFDTQQMLLDPLEEPLDLPAAFVQRGNRQRRQRRVVGQEHQCLARVGVLEADASQMLGVLPRGVVAVEHHALIADHSGAPLGGDRVHAPRVHGRLGPRDKECPGLMQRIQTFKVHVAAIHDVKGAGLECQHV